MISYIEMLAKADDNLTQLNNFELCLIANQRENIDEIYKLCNHLLYAITELLKDERDQFKNTLQIGAIICPEQSIDGKEALNFVRNTIDTSKKYSSFNFYKENTNKDLIQLKYIHDNLRKAMRSNLIDIFYQPQVDSFSKKVKGIESLLHWTVPESNTILNAADIIQVAQNSGILPLITNYSFRASAELISHCIDKGYANITLAINISPCQYLEKRNLNNIMSIIDDHALCPSQFELEIDINSLFKDKENIIGLDRLKDLGFNLIIQNITTKYFYHLMELKNSPIDGIKLSNLNNNLLDNVCHEKIQFKNLFQECINNQWLSSIVGIENYEQIKYFQELGCDYAQGYLFSKPISKEKIIDYLYQQATFGLVEIHDKSQ